MSDCSLNLFLLTSFSSRGDDFTPLSPVLNSPKGVGISELTSLRRKFQREAIDTLVQRPQLWSATLRLLSYSRTLLYKTRPVRSSNGILAISRGYMNENGTAVKGVHTGLQNLRIREERSLRNLWTSSTVMKHPSARQIQTRILRYAADPRFVLNDRQVRKIIDYGNDPRSISRERDHRAKDVSHQIWHLLESVGCLSYII